MLVSSASQPCLRSAAQRVFVSAVAAALLLNAVAAAFIAGAGGANGCGYARAVNDLLLAGLFADIGALAGETQYCFDVVKSVQLEDVTSPSHEDKIRCSFCCVSSGNVVVVVVVLVVV